MAKRFVTTKVEVEGREETKVVELPTRDPEPWGDDASLHIVGRRDKRMEFNPEPDTVINGGDKLVVLGRPESLRDLEKESAAQ